MFCEGRIQVGLVCAICAVCPTWVQAQYTIVEVGSFEKDGNSSANAVNDAGQVVGGSDGMAFVWEEGEMHPLGTLGGAQSYAYGINSAGEIVGSADTEEGLRHAFLYRSGQMTDLGTLGGPTSSASAVGDAGDVAGSSKTADGDDHAFHWREGVMRDLGTLGGDYSYGNDVNAHGVVVGSSKTKDGRYHAFVWTIEKGMIDLHPGEGRSSGARAINDHGQIVGFWAAPGRGPVHIVMWENGEMVDLGSHPHAVQANWIEDINEHGMILGRYSNGCRPIGSFLYVNGRFVDLNDLADPKSPTTLEFARGMNNLGHIVGWGSNDAFLISPPDCHDADADARCDDVDVCPLVWDYHQEDTDADGEGDACDLDDDGDGHADMDDNCPLASNRSQRDTDDNGIGDACEPRIPRFAMTDIGTLKEGTYSRAFAINEAGDVVGWSNNRAFIWRDGRLVNLNELLPSGSKWRLDLASDINDNGQVVGCGQVGGPTVGFIFDMDDSAAVESLVPMKSEWWSAPGHRLNNRGQVVGWIDNPDGYGFRACVWEDGVITELGRLPGSWNLAYDINDAGQIAGALDTGKGRTHGFLWKNGEMSQLPDPAGYRGSYAFGISRGFVVGSAFYREGVGPLAHGGGEPSIWQVKKPAMLPTLGGIDGTAFAVNDHGWAVGFSDTLPCDSTPSKAFLFFEGVTHALDDLTDVAEGWTLEHARDINNAGQIVGWGRFENRDLAYSLTPTYLPREADFDHDGFVDLSDYDIFAVCLGGPDQGGVPDGCDEADFHRADFNDDGSVDLRDFVGMQAKIEP